MKTLPFTSSLIIAVACLLQSANAQTTFIEYPTDYAYVPTMVEHSMVEHSSEIFYHQPVAPVVWVNVGNTLGTPTHMELSASIVINTGSPNPIIEKDSPAVTQTTSPTTTKTEALPVKATVQVQNEVPVYSAPIVPYYPPAPTYSAVCLSGG